MLYEEQKRMYVRCAEEYVFSEFLERPLTKYC